MYIYNTHMFYKCIIAQSQIGLSVDVIFNGAIIHCNIFVNIFSKFAMFSIIKIFFDNKISSTGKYPSLLINSGDNENRDNY